ncbi:hypothetical protein GG344DRAFT_82782 [Lentinula edodes]|nr:hypothetical protein GG344DRAFT_82782 [Lentinula edodes]
MTGVRRTLVKAKKEELRLAWEQNRHAIDERDCKATLDKIRDKEREGQGGRGKGRGHGHGRGGEKMTLQVSSASGRRKALLTPLPMVLKSSDRVQSKICRSVQGISEAGKAKCSCTGDGFLPIDDTPAEQYRQAHSAKGASQTRFMDLMTPENNFELLVPEEEEEENEGGDCEEREHLLPEEDAEERDAKLRRPLEEEEKRILSSRTQVV